MEQTNIKQIVELSRDYRKTAKVTAKKTVYRPADRRFRVVTDKDIDAVTLSKQLRETTTFTVGPGGRDEHGVVEAFEIYIDEANFYPETDHHWVVKLTYQTEVIEHGQATA